MGVLQMPEGADEVGQHSGLVASISVPGLNPSNSPIYTKFSEVPVLAWVSTYTPTTSLVGKLALRCVCTYVSKGPDIVSSLGAENYINVQYVKCCVNFWHFISTSNIKTFYGNEMGKKPFFSFSVKVCEPCK